MQRLGVFWGRIATGAVLPRNDRDFCKGCGARQAGDREGRPYESVTRGAVGRAGRGSGPYGGQAGMIAFLFRMICPISFTAG